MSEPFVVEKVTKPDFSITFDPKMTQEDIDCVVQSLSELWVACGGSGPLKVEFKREVVKKP